MAYDYKDPRGIDVKKYREERHEREEARAERTKSHVMRAFRHALELVAVGLSYFQSSYIVRFLTAKLSMDVLVEVTARFGANAGHSLSTLLAALVAEPRLIAVGVAAVLLLVELIAGTCRAVSRGRRKKAAYARIEGMHRRDGRR